MESFFRSNGAPEPWHFILFVFCLAISFLIARFFLDKFLFRGLAIWLLRKGGTALRFNKATQAKIIKCTESMWKLTYYAAVEAFILQIAYHEPWFTDTRKYFRGWPNQELKPSLKLYYGCQCGFYLYSIVALLTWETRRKDFAVMMSHHVITVILIGYSFVTSFFRIGSVILALHDACDVFMEAGKVFHYSGKEVASSVSFGLFALSWFVLRLIFFPFWVIKASRFVLYLMISVLWLKMLSCSLFSNIGSYDILDYLNASEPYQKSLYYGFNTMLLTLLVFHVYWGILICLMIARMLKNRGKLVEDVRSDSEDDD